MIAFPRRAEIDSAPSLAPFAPPIDREHLARMTLGERSLEREVLELFDRQAEMLFARMIKAEPAVAAAAAHTLKGSARSIGAWQVAGSAEAVELAAAGKAAEFKAALGALKAAIAESKAAIAELLRAN
jgi:HPt (histidine-containing phosphotransfer) domain-containing protein